MRRLLIVIALLSAWHTPAVAGTFKFSGTLAASDFVRDPGFDELTSTFSGVVSFEDFNDSDNRQVRDNLPLSRFDPVTIGSTVFSVSNVFAQLFYDARLDLLGVVIFGEPNGAAVVGRTEDFAALFAITGLSADQINRPSGQLSLPPSGFFLEIETRILSAGPRTNNSTFTVAPVPLPATLPLISVGLGALYWVRRRRQATSL